MGGDTVLRARARLLADREALEPGPFAARDDRVFCHGSDHPGRRLMLSRAPLGFNAPGSPAPGRPLPALDAALAGDTLSRKPARVRPRPSAATVARQRRGKAELRREREQMPLREKVRQVIELQRFVYPLLSRRRTLEPWERPWEIEP